MFSIGTGDKDGISSLSRIGQVEAFKIGTDDWEQYTERLATNEKKVAVLITVVGSEHRCQLSSNLEDSPRFKSSVLESLDDLTLPYCLSLIIEVVLSNSANCIVLLFFSNDIIIDYIITIIITITTIINDDNEI